MAANTKAKPKASYDVDYTAAVAGIQKTKKRLMEIQPKVSAVSQKKINAELKILATAAALCRTKMSKTYA